MSDGVTIDRQNATATIRMRGDLDRSTTRELYDILVAIIRRRDVRQIVVDLAETRHLDTAGAVTLALGARLADRAAKELTLTHVTVQHRRVLELAPRLGEMPEPETPAAIEVVGTHILGAGHGLRRFGALIADIGRQLTGVASRRSRLPANSIIDQMVAMGVHGLFIVSLLNFMLGMTIGLQAAFQLQQFGVRVFVAEFVGISLVRELAPIMTAVIIIGRTGAAIAAELGTMRVRSEIDALYAMGISPTRYLVVPRLAALTFVQPALTMIAMVIGVTGGMFVVAITFDLSPLTFWHRLNDRLVLDDFLFGLSKSVVFAWCIGLVACHFGMRAKADPGSVGVATTRTVVTCIFALVVIDTIFATISSMIRYG